jgi:hypothetical protein
MIDVTHHRNNWRAWQQLGVGNYSTDFQQGFRVI